MYKIHFDEALHARQSPYPFRTFITDKNVHSFYFLWKTIVPNSGKWLGYLISIHSTYI